MNTPQFDGDELLALARFDIQANRLEAALTKVKTAFQLDAYPTDLDAFAARLYAQLKLFDKAKILYLKYLTNNPDQVTELFQLGMVNFDMGEKQEALNIWKQLLRDHPTHPPALYYSSIVLIETNDIDQAMRNLDVLIKSAPASNLYFERGKALLSSVKGNNKTNSSLGTDTVDFAYENDA